MSYQKFQTGEIVEIQGVNEELGITIPHHLDGCLAKVLLYLPEHGEYQLELLPDYYRRWGSRVFWVSEAHLEFGEVSKERYLIAKYGLIGVVRLLLSSDAQPPEQ